MDSRVKISTLKEGDIISKANTILDEKGVFAEFHKNPNLKEIDLNNKSLSGILRLILIKYISSFITDINQINSNEIKKIISILKKGIKPTENPEIDIKTNLSENSGRDILSYSNYICSIMND